MEVNGLSRDHGRAEQLGIPGIGPSRPREKQSFRPIEPKLSRDERKVIAKYMMEKTDQFTRWKKVFKIEQEGRRFCQCGSQFSIWECTEDRKTFKIPMNCNSRICEHCGRRYAAKLEPDMMKVLQPLQSRKRKGWGLFLLTLTTNTARYDGMPTRGDISRFYKESSAFFRLFYGKYKAYTTKTGNVIEDKRHYDYTRDHGKTKRTPRTPKIIETDSGPKKDYRRYRGAGYISSIEIGRNNNNLHCHAVVYAPFIPQSQLREAWKAITGDSYIVDIRPIRSLKKAAWYVLKYIVKPPQTDSLMDLAEYAIMIKGSRRLRAGGIFFDRIKAHKSKLRFCCPHCGGHLQHVGLFDTESHLTIDSPLLYELLRKAKPPDESPPALSAADIQKENTKKLLELLGSKGEFYNGSFYGN